MAPRGVKSAPGAIELNRHFGAKTDLLNLQCTQVTWTRFCALFDSWIEEMSMQFCAICSVASTRSLKRISIAIPPSSEISTAVEKATQKAV